VADTREGCIRKGTMTKEEKLKREERILCIEVVVGTLMCIALVIWRIFTA